MFVVKKHVQHEKKGTKTMATKEITKPVNEVGIIGQMYEDRKTGKKGVLESRETKYKTLMMRGDDGKSFNITYSTFKSNWRKYQGTDVIETASQKEEKKAEAKVEAEKKSQRAKSATKVLKEASDKPKVSVEEKRQALKALYTIISDAFTGVIPDVHVNTTSNYAVKVHYKNHLIMGAYMRLAENRYTFDCCSEVAKQIDPGKIKVEKFVNNEWRISTRYRFADTDLNDMLNIFVSVLTGYVDETYIKPEIEKQAKKKKNETKEKTEEE